MFDIDDLIGGALRQVLLNPADRECSPEVYADPVRAALAGGCGSAPRT